jgi:Uma2 family endonuclease
MIIRAVQSDPRPRRWTEPEYYRLADLGFFGGQKVELMAGEIILQYPEDQKGQGIRYPSNEPHERLWTKEEFYRLGELGFFQGQKAELWEGIIMVSSPQGPRHYRCLKRAGRLLDLALGPGFDVRLQGPLDLGLVTDPEPDIAVVPAVPDEYESAHPQTALLVIEVSDSTLASDRVDKASLYARAGMADFWIINLVDRQVEIFRNPKPDASQPFGFGFADRTICSIADAVVPLAAPHVQIPVADLLG